MINTFGMPSKLGTLADDGILNTERTGSLDQRIMREALRGLTRSTRIIGQARSTHLPLTKILVQPSNRCLLSKAKTCC